MKKNSVKIISLIVTVIIAVSCIIVPISAAENKKSFKMVVLGDSVANGSYVNTSERFGEVLADKVAADGYDVEYINYAVPKYGTRSLYYDLYEDTYAYDNNRFVEDHGAIDYRAGISYDEFIGNIATSNVVIIHLGENDLAAAFYKLRGYDDYYMFYGDEINIPLIQNDINNGKVDGIYTLNTLKIKMVQAEYRRTLKSYLTKDINRIKEINPNAQIIVCDMFNPYQKASDAMNYTVDICKSVVSQAIKLPFSSDFSEFMEKFAKLTSDYNTAVQMLYIMVPALSGKDIDHCAQFDLSSLRTTQKILYKIQYLRVEAASIEMYDMADEIIPQVVEETGVTMAKLSGTEVCNHMASDGSHPDPTGHALIADILYDAIDFDRF